MNNSKPVLCGSIAGTIGGMGAVIHNAAYQAEGIDFSYVSFKAESAADSISAMRTLGIRGLGVSMPFKREVMDFVDVIEEEAEKIGAINTIVNEEGVLHGYNTDCRGIRKCIEAVCRPDSHTRVVIIGAGGAGRAAIYALGAYTEAITLYNRDRQKGEATAKHFGISYGGQPGELVQDYDILINATSVGYRTEESILTGEQMKNGKIVMDVVFDPVETAFIRQASQLNCTVIEGWKVLLNQAVCQYELYTERSAPVEVMEKALLKKIREQ